MKKLNVLSKIVNHGIVAVVRGDSPQQAIEISDACIKGKLYGVEITFTVNDADQVIKQLVDKYQNNKDVVIGAGTVLDPYTARIAILAGAEFIVSPTFDKATAKICNMYQIPYMPGCLTITEMREALEYGVDIIKLFPGNGFGASFLKAVKAPLPQVNIMPTGGVSLDNIKDWISNGAVAVGVGGNLIAPAKDGDFEKITKIAEEYVKKVEEARGALL
ncbi:bifunctional 4-hydroxy-2-oxoglutarate aldolase/2-dehydro-3-deoxy-phosphogluconate aldolase [Aquibacillus rhizosphaerae]|uniref:Bifunctional 4-hydroxy-2-oxoglutarate aldolase/2-dehydro-3-deoxy-phosphogluconate aldolase n=1 Tax=Aquibacillus rhizosphaerae TaxID=3051431 RepID=A0ABT7L342_9BACI|nr:bifunctional 4-hydroxy-2-oxoglutarate aldolase/2-dehydro-3-deoxy-phosphogluconate aldolase [Aquibacillus sp. LR5S19]MDL4840284.1 bifunctional 4-hydroxy-2-oxoglutarate aldolase/2-dehydro-3-deoxy-phosphogluconate aldolase [Aquibacillus sp. LR5S19]